MDIQQQIDKMKKYSNITVAKLAKKAGVIMKEHFNSDFNIERKKDRSPITIIDKKINQLVIDTIKKNILTTDS